MSNNYEYQIIDKKLTILSNKIDRIFKLINDSLFILKHPYSIKEELRSINQLTKQLKASKTLSNTRKEEFINQDRTLEENNEKDEDIIKFFSTSD